MSVIKFLKANCKNCYKCVRSCPVKSIKIKDYQAEIMEDSCIMCGTCLQVCPQNAKHIRDDIDIVKGFMEDGYTVIASLAPSFVTLCEKPGKIIAAIKSLGFQYVEETAVGASAVSKKYNQLMTVKSEANMISSCCPTIVELIQRHYPQAVDQLAAVVSPMIAHGRAIKKERGQNVKVVFIGPCISKKWEASDPQTEGVIDAALTFEELINWFEKANIQIDHMKEASFDNKTPGSSRFYPMPGGILRSMGVENDIKNYYSIDGIEDCISTIDSIINGEVKGTFIEMSGCKGGCLNGPAMPKGKGGTIGSKVKLVKYADEKQGEKEIKVIKMEKEFFDRMPNQDIPNEEQINQIFQKLGKYDKDKEFNCGACGYSSCREKAIAVFQGKAELYMCIPYMKERAESLSNTVLSSTPNAIIAVSDHYEIQEFNPAAEQMFHLKKYQVIGKNIFETTEIDDFLYVKEFNREVIDKKIILSKFNKVGEITILHIKEKGIFLALIKDITETENEKEKLKAMKTETMKMAQQVIDKQMYVAQQIAGLLGETTAETKVTLTKLKTIMTTHEES